MKVNKYIILILYMAVIPLLSGCIKDDPGTDVGMVAGGNEIDFEFAMPQYAHEVLGTRGTELPLTEPATAVELKIWDAHLLVFRGNTRLRYERMDVDKITDNETALPRYRSYFNYIVGDRFVVLLNTGYTTDFPYAAINNVDDINKATKTSPWMLTGTPKIPMCGEEVLADTFSLAAGAGKAKVTIPVYRSVSRFGVTQKAGLSLDGKPWVIDQFEFKQTPLGAFPESPAAQHNYIAPNSDVPTLKEAHTERWYSNSEKKTVGTFSYFPAYPTSRYINLAILDFTVYHQNRAHAIIRASWNGTFYFYRIDLANQVEVDDKNELRHGKWFDFKKNTAYTIQVNGVKGHGYSTAAEASANPGKNIVYDVIVDDAYSNFVKSNGHYAIGLSRREVYAPGSLKNTTIDVAYVRYISPIYLPTPNTISVITASIIPSGATFTTTTTSLTPTSTMLKATVSENFEEGKIAVAFGELTDTITVRRGAYLNVDITVPDWDGGGGGDVDVED